MYKSAKYDVKNLHLYRTLKPVDQNLKKTLIALESKSNSLKTEFILNLFCLGLDNFKSDFS